MWGNPYYYKLSMLLLSLLLSVRMWGSPLQPAQEIAFNVFSSHAAGVNREWVCPRHPNLCLLRSAALRRGGAASHSVVPCLSQGNVHAIRVPQDSHCYKTAVSPKGFVLMHRGQWFASRLDCNAVIICISASSLNRQRKISRDSSEPEVESELWSKESNKGWGVSLPNQSFGDKFSVLLSYSNLLKTLPPQTCKIFYCWPQRWQTRPPLHHWLRGEAAVQCWYYISQEILEQYGKGGGRESLYILLKSMWFFLRADVEDSTLNTIFRPHLLLSPLLRNGSLGEYEFSS